MEKEEMITSFDGTKLFMKRDLPENMKAVVVIVHGLCEHQGRYDYLVEMFNAAGLGCYRFDHRGHGRSEGERTFFSSWTDMTDDANVVTDMAIAENPGKKVFMLGHSMGGFCVAAYGVRYPGKLAGIVLSGAVTYDNRRLISDLPRDMDVHTKLPNELGDGVCSVKAVRDAYEADPWNTKTFTAGLCYSLIEGVAFLGEHYKEFAYPVLMLHGELDALVSLKDTYEGFATVASKDRQMKVYGGLFHEIFNEYCHDETIGDAAGWILNRV